MFALRGCREDLIRNRYVYIRHFDFLGFASDKRSTLEPFSKIGLKPTCRSRYVNLICVGGQIVDLVRTIERYRSR